MFVSQKVAAVNPRKPETLAPGAGGMWTATEARGSKGVPTDQPKKRRFTEWIWRIRFGVKIP
jgi:hypothetical protein